MNVGNAAVWDGLIILGGFLDILAPPPPTHSLVFIALTVVPLLGYRINSKSLPVFQFDAFIVVWKPLYYSINS